MRRGPKSEIVEAIRGKSLSTLFGRDLITRGTGEGHLGSLPTSESFRFDSIRFDAFQVAFASSRMRSAVQADFRNRRVTIKRYADGVPIRSLHFRDLR